MKIALPAVLVAAAAVILLLVVVVPRMLPSAVNDVHNRTSTTTLGATPSIVANDGSTISALPRPTVLASLEAGAARDDSSADGASSQATEPVGGTGSTGETDGNGALTGSIPSYTVDPGMGNVLYVKEAAINDSAKQYLEQNGFVITVIANYDEFFEVYEKNRYFKFPNLVTTDAMMHTYHLYFSHLMKNTEREYLAPKLLELNKSMLAASESQLETLQGTEWEDAATRNVAFFAVGAALLDPSAQVPSSVSSTVETELAAINAASGISVSQITGKEVDYSQYIVRGYYEGDTALEPYFRAMMWCGQMNFTQKDEDLDRSALLMTLALDDGNLEAWEQIYSITSFFAGASDDCGYYEYLPLFEAAYGEGATTADLPGNDNAWNNFHDMTAKMPAPQINSVVVHDEGEDADHADETKGYRFMGQRFTIDESIFNQLVYSRVGDNPQGEKRMLPNALDVPAALGSDEALEILEEKGQTSFSNYKEHMNEMREQFESADSSVWNASLYSNWLYTLGPLLDTKGEGYPQFMQSENWTRKNLQTYLGSYTELKHDTVLYTKQVMAEMGGGPDRTDDRGYVEPEPELYGRLANLVGATSDGLAGYGMLGTEDADNLAKLRDLSTQLKTISEKELANETLTDEEYELIRSFGGQLEHFWTEVYKDEKPGQKLFTKDFPAAIVTDVATDPNGKVLELGTGRPSNVFAIVPVDGTLRVASGSVFSFYQFDWPMSDRLTDSSWREMMGFVFPENSRGRVPSSKPDIHVEDWTRSFQVEQTYN